MGPGAGGMLAAPHKIQPWGGYPPCQPQNLIETIGHVHRGIPPPSTSQVSQHPGGPPGPSDTLAGIYMMLQNIMQQLADNRQREDEKDRRIAALENTIHQMQRAPPPSFQNNAVHRRWQPLRVRFPDPKHSPETPQVNAYLDKCAMLEEKEKSGELEPESDVKCKFVDHDGDLLAAPQMVKAHCINTELRLQKGIAAQVVEKIGLPPSDPFEHQVGDVIEQETPDGKFVHIFTKHKARHHFNKKPERFLGGAEKAIKKFAQHIRENQYEEVAVPKLSGGLDGLKWIWTKQLLMEELKDVPVVVHVYHWNPTKRWLANGEEGTSHERNAGDKNNRSEKNGGGKGPTTRSRSNLI